MKKRLFVLAIVGGVVLALAGAAVVEAKAHVPLGRAQICTSGGVVKNVAARVMQNRLNSGACRLTACAFNDVDNDDNIVQQFIFLAGDDCDPTDDNGDNFCDATGAPKDVPRRVRAINVTPACTDPF